jgi:hypothetical protein
VLELPYKWIIDYENVWIIDYENVSGTYVKSGVHYTTDKYGRYLLATTATAALALASLAFWTASPKTVPSGQLL